MMRFFCASFSHARRLSGCPRLIVLLTFSLLSAAGFATDVEVDLQSELKVEAVSFGQGVAEALRGTGNRRALVPKDLLSGNQGGVRFTETAAGFSIVWFQKIGDKDVSFAESMRIDRSGFRLLSEFVVGATKREDIRSRFGKPLHEDQKKIVVSAPGYAGDDLITFEFERAVLTAVVWAWYVD